MAHQLEALYVVQFGDVAQGGHYRGGGGVVVLKGGRLLGGDAGYYFVGTYTADAKALRADVKIVKYDPEARNAFGNAASSFNVDVDLAIGDAFIEGHMQERDRPGMQLPLRLIWKEPLP